MNTVFLGKVNKGVLQVEARFYSHLATLEGQEVEVVVRKKKTQRSNQQSRYYFGVIVKMISDHTGFEPEEVHYALRERFLGSEVDEKSGLRIVKSTTSLSTKEFIDQYTDPIKRWTQEFLGFRIPEPNEVDY